MTEVSSRTRTGEPEAPPIPRVFVLLLVNTLMTGVTSTFLWFALTFWVYLETRSVVLTGVIAGAFSLSSALLGPVFGTFVDRQRKHTAMVFATALSVLSFALATAVFVAIDSDDLLRLRSPFFWILVATTLLGSVAGQLRGIALSTCVTLLVRADHRDRANGMVGTVSGASMAITSVFSGIVIGWLGMGWAYYLALALTAAALVHLLTIRFVEPDPERTADGSAPAVDVRGAIEAIRAVPGLTMLIGLAAFNNLLTGVFMALMDPYGLELVSVQTWGLLFGFTSCFFILGGVVVARYGLGRKPVRILIIGNLINWAACAVFTLRPWIVLFTIGMAIWLTLIPAIEAAEQTVLQQSIPYERQGRVFGFAQFVEQAASPLTAFFMAPLAEAVFIPFMTDGRGADVIGSWFGTGFDRGIALMFTIAGVLGIVVTALAWTSRSYKRLTS
jgi:MFS transporter, DHA3 family, multidrug efflux protein